MKASTCSRYSKIVKSHKDQTEYINRKIDENSKSGKLNEDAASNHYVGSTQDGSRVWSF